MKFFLFLLITSLFFGCYRSPNDDDSFTVPATNNPHVIQDKSVTFPGLGY